MKHSAETIRAAIAPEAEAMLEALRVDSEVPPFLKNDPHFQHLWCAGCWLSNALQEQGCPEDRRRDIEFEHGQRSFHGDPYETAAALFTAFCEGALQERPGHELAEELLDNAVERKEDGSVVLKVASPTVKKMLEREFDRLRKLSPKERAAELAALDRFFEERF